MRNLATILLKKETKRRLLAAFFLIFFVGELGSHVAICVNHPFADRLSASSKEDGHDDPCKYLILCNNGTRKDQQLFNIGHDATQYNALIDHLADFPPAVEARKKSITGFESTRRIFQPVSPPFHPPELA